MLECRNCKYRVTCESGRELIKSIEDLGAYVTHEALEQIEEIVESGSEPCSYFEVDSSKKSLGGKKSPAT